LYILEGRTGNDTYVSLDNGAAGETVTVIDSGGTDTLDFAIVSDPLEFTVAAGGITVTRDNGPTVVAGPNMIENLVGGTGSDVFRIENGVNLGGWIDGGTGATNTLDYSSWTTPVAVNLSLPDAVNTDGTATGTTGVVRIQHVSGGQAGDEIIGDAQANLLVGGPGNDTLRGLSRDDTLEGGPGEDILDGGFGSDTASYENAAPGVTVDLNLTVQAAGSGEATGDELTDIENLIGSPHDDTLTGNGQPNVIEGGAGEDRITGGGGGDTASYVSSTEGVVVDLNIQTQNTGTGDAFNDILIGIQNVIGSNSADTLIGSAKDNVLMGGAGTWEPTPSTEDPERMSMLSSTSSCSTGSMPGRSSKPTRLSSTATLSRPPASVSPPTRRSASPQEKN
jgi:Ca2+-binding RTX toxin-like protein